VVMALTATNSRLLHNDRLKTEQEHNSKPWVFICIHSI
jgi:hypothetical protein